MVSRKLAAERRTRNDGKGAEVQIQARVRAKGHHGIWGTDDGKRPGDGFHGERVGGSKIGVVGEENKWSNGPVGCRLQRQADPASVSFGPDVVSANYWLVKLSQPLPLPEAR